jgi:SAM-dependent methyltransferase
MTDWAREVMNKRTGEFVDKMETASRDALEISGRFWSRYRWKTYTTVGLPAFDICRDAIYDRQFDMVFAEQVFEHLLYPYRAGRNVWQMMRPGGYFVLTTPFLIRVHNEPTDCTRWTAQGLAYFLEECGFDRHNIQADSWGSRACVIANLDRWVEFAEGIHSLDNEPAFPVVVWALAKK